MRQSHLVEHHDVSRAVLRPEVGVPRPDVETIADVEEGVQLPESRPVDTAAVSRLQAAEDGRLILQFEQTVPTLVYTWLADAEKRFGVTPERVSMFAEADGTVRASFEFAGGGS